MFHNEANLPMNDSSFSPEVTADLEYGLDILELDRAYVVPLLAYLALLIRWNRTYNLTAIRDPRRWWSVICSIRWRYSVM